MPSMGYLQKSITVQCPVTEGTDTRSNLHSVARLDNPHDRPMEEIEEDDAIALVPSGTEHNGRISVPVTGEISVCYSATYSVPVLHFTAHDASKLLRSLRHGTAR